MRTAHTKEKVNWNLVMLLLKRENTDTNNHN